MSYDSYTSDSSSTLLGRFDFRHLLTLTLVLVAATILLGVAARATGSGLACEANWPQCDAGPYNLLPANLPSFYEWIHRFVAMFAGFAIVGTAAAAALASSVDRRVTGLVVVGTILTPIQVILGRETVLQYELEILSLHFWTAVLIFVLFVVATVIVWRSRLRARHVTIALGTGAVMVPLHVAFSPLFITDITTYSPSIQTAQYGITLALLAAVTTATMVGWRRFDQRLLTGLFLALPALAMLVLFLGRRAVMTLSPVLDLVYVATAGALFAAFVAGIWLVRERVEPNGSASA
ncbi:cytochrome oxidase assembly protein [Natrononativus amylolyticus]|uniref:cytochrome oxidase assembly protein n=1 Tax=Natrononativus amylolyticus TaxID=2963434 RepID=UPI0020CF6B84|nr:cytochrome oxidase assembly protein [Natrononativus amylolyticus]